MNLHDENGNLVNFCVPLEGSDKEKRAVAIEVVSKSIDMGAYLNHAIALEIDGESTAMANQIKYIGCKNAGTFVGELSIDFAFGTTKVEIGTIGKFRAYYDKWKSEQWPDDDSPRNQAIQQNGNTAEHYDEEEISELGCFEQVASVIGDEAAIRELGLIKDWNDKTDNLAGAFIWGRSPQGVGFWNDIDDGVNPYTNSRTKEKAVSDTQDNVSNPSHYQLLPGVEVKHVREAILNNAPEGIPYNQIDDWSRAWEYLTRMWGKNGLEDAKKARVYLNWLIEKMEKSE